MKKNKEINNHFLPVDILFLIFSFLPLKALPIVFQVCKKWSLIGQDERFWAAKWNDKLETIRNEFENFQDDNTRPAKDKLIEYQKLFSKTISLQNHHIFWKKQVKLYPFIDKDSFRNSILHGHLDVLSYLLKSCKDINFEFEIKKGSILYKSLTLLGLAVLEGKDCHIPIVKLLIEHGADINRNINIITISTTGVQTQSYLSTQHSSKSLMEFSKNTSISCFLNLAKAEFYVETDQQLARNCYQRARLSNEDIFNEYFFTISENMRGLGLFTINNPKFFAALKEISLTLEADNSCVIS